MYCEKKYSDERYPRRGNVDRFGEKVSSLKYHPRAFWNREENIDDRPFTPEQVEIYTIIIDDLMENLLFQKTIGEWDNWNEK